MQSLSWRCTTCHLKAVFSACVSVAKSMRNCVWHMWLRLTGFIIRYIRSDLDRQKILNLSPKLITLSDQVERSQKQSMQKSSLSHVTETTMPCGPDNLSTCVYLITGLSNCRGCNFGQQSVVQSLNLAAYSSSERQQTSGTHP